MKPNHIFLIRHGESQANVDPSVYETTPDHKIELTGLGQKQAVQAGQRLRNIIKGKTAIYCSPFQRTRQTLEYLLAGFGSAKKQITRIREDPRLREQEWGHLRLLAEIGRIEKERHAFGTFYYRIPDGESGADVYDRCTGVLDSLYRDFKKPGFPPNAIIVSHGLTIRLLLMRWLHWTVEEFEEKRGPENCEIFHLLLSKNGHYRLEKPFPTRTCP
ncbi:MAG: histidine phosphatase family protein [Opitutaceae bacterium]|jgi:broad specificity phosphatase PhoE|nr:histidine phosphatase family protein [Opitutaceae bacterium]